MPNKSYVYLLHVQPSKLVLKTFKVEFHEVIATITDQNSRPLEI